MPCFISDLTRTVKPPEMLLVCLFFGLIRLTAEKLGRVILSSKGQCVSNKHIISLLQILLINAVSLYICCTLSPYNH